MYPIPSIAEHASPREALRIATRELFHVPKRLGRELTDLYEKAPCVPLFAVGVPKTFILFDPTLQSARARLPQGTTFVFQCDGGCGNEVDKFELLRVWNVEERRPQILVFREERGPLSLYAELRQLLSVGQPVVFTVTKLVAADLWRVDIVQGPLESDNGDISQAINQKFPPTESWANAALPTCRSHVGSKRKPCSARLLSRIGGAAIIDVHADLQPDVIDESMVETYLSDQGKSECILLRVPAVQEISMVAAIVKSAQEQGIELVLVLSKHPEVTFEKLQHLGHCFLLAFGPPIGTLCGPLGPQWKAFLDSNSIALARKRLCTGCPEREKCDYNRRGEFINKAKVLVANDWHLRNKDFLGWMRRCRSKATMQMILVEPGPDVRFRKVAIPEKHLRQHLFCVERLLERSNKDTKEHAALDNQARAILSIAGNLESAPTSRYRSPKFLDSIDAEKIQKVGEELFGFGFRYIGFDLMALGAAEAELIAVGDDRSLQFCLPLRVPDSKVVLHPTLTMPGVEGIFGRKATRFALISPRSNQKTAYIVQSAATSRKYLGANAKMLGRFVAEVVQGYSGPDALRHVCVVGGEKARGAWTRYLVDRLEYYDTWRGVLGMVPTSSSVKILSPMEYAVSKDNFELVVMLDAVNIGGDFVGKHVYNLSPRIYEEMFKGVPGDFRSPYIENSTRIQESGMFDYLSEYCNEKEFEQLRDVLRRFESDPNGRDLVLFGFPSLPSHNFKTVLLKDKRDLIDHCHGGDSILIRAILDRVLNGQTVSALAVSLSVTAKTLRDYLVQEATSQDRLYELMSALHKNRLRKASRLAE